MRAIDIEWIGCWLVEIHHLDAYTNCYGRMKINATGEIVSLTEHRHEPEFAEKHPPECPVSMQ